MRTHVTLFAQSLVCRVQKKGVLTFFLKKFPVKREDFIARLFLQMQLHPHYLVPADIHIRGLTYLSTMYSLLTQGHALGATSSPLRAGIFPVWARLEKVYPEIRASSVICRLCLKTGPQTSSSTSSSTREPSKTIITGSISTPLGQLKQPYSSTKTFLK